MNSIASAKLYGLNGHALAAALSLLAVALLALWLAIRTVLRRRGRGGLGAGAAAAVADLWQGIGGPSFAPRPQTPTVRPGEPRLPTTPARPYSPFGVPPNFDTAGFLASAQRSFVRLQSAWDQSDLKELAECATEDMASALAHELRVRVRPSRTDIARLEATLLGIETVDGEHRASVRFSGLLRINDEDERLDEVWNLTRPVDGSGGWLLSGIQQLN